jgi:NAD(P)-dependent dehydrogenase (short-subunit alcohol dehydrogenase family)
MQSNLRFADKVAIVTGGASGIGEAIVRQLLAEGARVVVADINEARLNLLAPELGDRCLTVRTDVTRETDIEALVAAALRRFGKIDVAFNVAGAARMAAITEQSEADWDFPLDLCLKGAFLSMKHIGRQMIASGTRGAIVNVASLNCQIPGWGMAAACAAKAGLEMLGKSGCLEFGEHGIRVNTVSPGLTKTPASAFMPKEMVDSFLERIPLQRVATPEDQAQACLFLASDAAAYITGANLFVDGGWAHTAYPDMRPYYGKGSKGA